MTLAGRAILLLVAHSVAAGALPAAAHADDGSICRRPEILAFAMDKFEGADAHIEMLQDTATEVATSRAEVVMCVVTVRVRLYDPGDYRDRPAVLDQPRYFEVKRLKDGFEVNFDGR